MTHLAVCDYTPVFLSASAFLRKNALISSAGWQVIELLPGQDQFVLGNPIMRRLMALGLAVALLAGCATFSGSETAALTEIPDRDTMPVSLKQMRLLVPGEWYAVRLPEKDGRSLGVGGIFHTGYVGQLLKSDADSLTLTSVVKCTDFDSKSALRHLPVIGSKFETGWMDCKNEAGTVTVPRAKVMWFEPISAQTANRFRRFNEIVNESFDVAANVDSNSPTDPPARFESQLPDASFLLPNPQGEENRSRRWIAVREMKIGQWYNIIPIDAQGNGKDQKLHVGLVDHVDKDSVTLTDVTTGHRLARAYSGTTTSPELTLPYTQIDTAIPLTAEQVAEQIALFNQPRKSLTSERE